MKIKETTLVIPGAPLEGVNPLPKFRSRKPNEFKTAPDFPDDLRVGVGNYSRVLPYLMQDRYSRRRIPLKLKCIVLENKYLKAEFLPEFGGRLHSLFDKVNNFDLILKNSVIQPCNLAIRNAWLSGGIEWNIGSFGHTFTTCDNVFCAKLTDNDGNDFIRIYEFEKLKSIYWQVDFHLPDDSKYLICHVRMVNPYPTDTTTYWWTNIAVPEERKTRVLSSDTTIISFFGGMMKYEELPEIQAMPNTDVSYPANATRAFDYFIQAEDKNSCTWEAAAYKSGKVFFERSTPPLTCKKLFCWGNHHAGDHWQEFLSEKGKGYYAEIQAGIAPSQLHDYKLPKNTTFEWTQCFGSTEGDAKILHSDDYKKAREYLSDIIDSELSESDILALDKKYAKLADTEISESNLIHLGSGYGALESLRIQKCNENVKIPKTVCFPAFTMKKEEAPWAYLIENGVFPAEDTRFFTPSYNVSDCWKALIEKSLEVEGGKTWYSLMQYGVTVYESTRLDTYAVESYSDEDNQKRTATAEKAWLDSLKLEKSYIAYRNLAILEEQRGNIQKAADYYMLALDCDGAYDDFALLSEAMILFNENKEFEKVWNLFENAPENCTSADRVRINAAKAAIKLNKLDFLAGFFEEKHYDIREGENPLTDIWFEYSAKKLAAEREVDITDEAKLNELMDEALEICPPPYEIDFRMSLEKNNKYRVN